MPRKVYASKNQTKPDKDIPNPNTPIEDKKPLNTTIRDLVLENIGRPDDLARVDVFQLYDNHYRVNVYREVRTAQIKMFESFYIVMTPDGIVSSPPMRKRYHDVELTALSLSS